MIHEKRFFIAAALIVIASTILVRVLLLLDGRVETERADGIQTLVIKPYRAEADRMASQGVLLPPEAVAEEDARMALHPPGYSLLILMLQNISANPERWLRAFQIAVDALTALIVFGLTSRLLRPGIGLITGLLIAFSPQLAYYSLWLSPDSLVTLPTVLAVYFLAMSSKEFKLTHALLAGVLIGISCWLRSNGLLLAPAFSTFLVLKGGKRALGAAGVLTATTALMILPLTIRNYVVYHKVIPTSIGNGITMIEGIADFDTAGRFGFSPTDGGCVDLDVKWYGRQDYGGNLWAPDGIERDRDRFRRGLGVAISHPFWFGSTMLRRSLFMFRYNDSKAYGWPFDTSRVPIVSPEPRFTHSPFLPSDAKPAYTGDPLALQHDGHSLSQLTHIEVSGDGHILRIIGDGRSYADQFTTQSIQVQTRSDYILQIDAQQDAGHSAIKVTDATTRVSLASDSVPDLKEAAGTDFIATKDHKAPVNRPSYSTEAPDGKGLRQAIPFATGPNHSVRIVLSNNEPSSGPDNVSISSVSLYYIGPTASSWTIWLRKPVAFIQKKLFTTSTMAVLTILGVLLVRIYTGSRPTLIFLSVPIYYATAQSALHTEFRYILPVQVFMLVFIGTSIFVLFSLGCQLLKFSRDFIENPEKGREALQGATCSIKEPKKAVLNLFLTLNSLFARAVRSRNTFFRQTSIERE